MLRKSILFGIVFALLAPSAATAVSAKGEAWQPIAGDVFVVDVKENTGYLVHPDGSRLSFPVSTGRKGYVSYIGRYYKAETPVRTWTAQQFQIKGDRHTFGVNGRFIRLYRNGEDSAYGIHSYYKEQDWMNADGRYFSMGCILVTEDMMDIMEKTFEANEHKFIVITTNDAVATLEKITASAENGKNG